MLKTELNDKQVTKLIGWFNKILDNGYTFLDIKNEMIIAKKNNADIRWKIFSKPKPHGSNVNLLKSNIRYYHKELLIRNSPTVVDHDIDNGTLVSHNEDFFVEPSASYTMDEFIKYFYLKIHPDTIQYNPKRMTGFFTSMLNSFSIDVLLFMIEAISRNEERCGKAFTVNNIMDYYTIAQQYINDIKQNCAQFGGNYVYRKYMSDM